MFARLEPHTPDAVPVRIDAGQNGWEQLVAREVGDPYPRIRRKQAGEERRRVGHDPAQIESADVAKKEMSFSRISHGALLIFHSPDRRGPSQPILAEPA